METFCALRAALRGFFSCVLSWQRYDRQWPKVTALCSWGWGCWNPPPQQVQGRARSSKKILKFSVSGYLDEVKEPSCLPVYWTQGQNENSSSLGTYEKIRLIRFHKFIQVEAANQQTNLHIDDIHQIDNRRTKRPRGFHLAFALFTVLMSYKQNTFSLFSMLLHLELQKSFLQLCQTNEALYLDIPPYFILRKGIM